MAQDFYFRLRRYCSANTDKFMLEPEYLVSPVTTSHFETYFKVTRHLL